MLIKEIVLENFRAYMNKQVISFATDEEKNITVIMGENGSGKTTLAQAFLWVLYGETEFKVKSLLNINVKDKMKVNDEKKVKVELYIYYEGTDYRIIRSQIYSRDYSGVKPHNSEFEISYNKNGQQEFLKPNDRDVMIKKMLPRQLSKFFFFDGERIKAMSEEIEKGKSKEFADAVRGLVGLTALINAINHLKSSATNTTVIGRYNKKIDESGNEKILEYSSKIKTLQDDKDYLEKRINELETHVDYYLKESEKLKLQIASYATAEKMQSEYNKLSSEISKLVIIKTDAVKLFLNYFNKNTPAFLSKPLIHSSLLALAETERLDKGIPDMTADTIDYLIKRGLCVCKTKLDPGSDAYLEICKALEYLPPKSIGLLINRFVKESQDKTKLSETYFEMFETALARVREIQKQISDKQTELTNIDNNLLDISEVSGLKKKQLDAENKASAFKKEMRQKVEDVGSIKTKIGRWETERNQLILIDERNRENEIYRQYALCLYEELKSAYDLHEKITRYELERNINEVFTNIFSDALSIKVDEKYNIIVSVKGHYSNDNDLEYSTSQNYSIIFAFIAGIIKMAKEAGKKGKENDEELSVFIEAEGYPLVMDAPLSAFDKRRIKNICDTIPKIARQVIFFIKDTDGNVAEEYLGNNLGSKYIINIDNRGLIADINVR